jgi:hypothetical protein
MQTTLDIVKGTLPCPKEESKDAATYPQTANSKGVQGGLGRSIQDGVLNNLSYVDGSPGSTLPEI